jgi:RNA polymerase sigma-70 factor (ECF subfamily)
VAENSILKELGERFHARLIAGDKLVTAEISEVFFPALCESAERKFHYLSDHHIVTVAAEEAFLAYLNHPEKFDPQKGSLIGYLFLAARLNVIDRLRTSKKNTVGLDPSILEHMVEGPITNPETMLITEESAHFAPSSPAMRRMFSVVTDPVDHEVVKLLMEGERKTEVFAKVMGILHLPLLEQQEQVNLRKDRLKTALRRNLKQWDPR